MSTAMRNASFVTQLSLAVAVVVFAACDGGPDRLPPPLPQPSPVVPTPESLPPPPPPSIPAGARIIVLGEEVKDSLVDEDRYFVMTAPSHGTLVVRLILQPGVQDSGAMVLRLKVNGTEFPPGYPALAHMGVVAGQQVLVTVSNAGGYSGWDYAQVGPHAADAGLPFVMNTSIE